MILKSLVSAWYLFDCGAAQQPSITELIYETVSDDT